MDLGRISVDHQIMGGVPCVTGTRIPVATVVGLVANGLTTGEIVAEYPQLTPADVVRAENLVHGPDQQSCLPEGPP